MATLLDRAMGCPVGVVCLVATNAISFNTTPILAVETVLVPLLVRPELLPAVRTHFVPPQLRARARCPHGRRTMASQGRTNSVTGKSSTEPPDQAEIPRAQADGERPDARLDPRPRMMNSAPPLPLHGL
ncbi:hypothetical protein THAOC_37873, partial [Thalassiosira oceanica]